MITGLNIKLSFSESVATCATYINISLGMSTLLIKYVTWLGPIGLLLSNERKSEIMANKLALSLRREQIGRAHV